MSDLMLSVAIITYNQEKYISQTLDSILNQKHDYSYEIVIGDDCSKDNTVQIIKDYAARYPSIIKPIFNNPNKGIIKNYFNVIEHCTGKYLMECAGDDYWLPGKVAFQIDFMEKHSEIGMCYSRAKSYNEIKHKFSGKKFGSDKTSFENLFYCGNDIPALTVCFRNELIKKYIRDINPVSQNWLMEDYPMWIYMNHESKIHFEKKYFGCYRILADSASHNNKSSEKQYNFAKSEYSMRLFYSEFFNINIEDFNEDKIWFDIIWSNLKFNLKLNQEEKEKFKKICQNKKNFGFKSKVKKFIISLFI